MDLEDDSSEDLVATGNIKVEKSPEIMIGESSMPLKGGQPIKEEQNEEADFDIASVLLDLKRQVRLTSVKPEPMTSPIERENEVANTEQPRSEDLCLVSVQEESAILLAIDNNSCREEDKSEVQTSISTPLVEEVIHTIAEHEVRALKQCI